MYKEFFGKMFSIMNEVLETQGDAIRKGSEMMAEAIARKSNIYAFGAGHAGILAQEMVYRTGGLAVINLIYAPGLTLDVRPITLTSYVERQEGYGRALIDSTDIKEGDLLIMHSVSGRNTVPVDMAIRAREKGAKVICLTNLKYSKSVPSRHPSGQHLYEVSDLIIDNCGDIGDAAMEVPNVPQKVASSSTVVGAAILDSMVAETVEILAAQGIVPPVFCSANMEGGDAINKVILDNYSDNIKYM